MQPKRSAYAHKARRVFKYAQFTVLTRLALHLSTGGRGATRTWSGWCCAALVPTSVRQEIRPLSATGAVASPKIKYDFIISRRGGAARKTVSHSCSGKPAPRPKLRGNGQRGRVKRMVCDLATGGSPPMHAPCGPARHILSHHTCTHDSFYVYIFSWCVSSPDSP